MKGLYLKIPKELRHECRGFKKMAEQLDRRAGATLAENQNEVNALAA